jgi:Uma2 family endonuclease
MEKGLSSQPRTLFTPEEYLRIERPALNKSEYLNGEVLEMSGVNREHNRIVRNLSHTSVLRKPALHAGIE